MTSDVERLCRELIRIYNKYELNEVWLKLAGAIRVIAISNNNKINVAKLKLIIGDNIDTELVWGILKTLEKYNFVTVLQEADHFINEVFLINC